MSGTLGTEAANWNRFSAPESKEKLDPAAKFKELTPQQRDFLNERKRKRAEMKNKQLVEAYVPINLFEAEKPMGIFQDVASEEQKIESSNILKTWQAISEREMRILKTQSPRNLIEDMAGMTDKGILWHFPIDNGKLPKRSFQCSGEKQSFEHFITTWSGNHCR